MNLKEKILIFRTCLAVLVTLKKLINEEITNESARERTTGSLQALIKPVTDHINHLYAEEDKENVRRK